MACSGFIASLLWFLMKQKKGNGAMLNADGMHWSPSGRFLATHCEHMGNMVWIWDISSKLQLLSILQHLRAVRSLKWHPKEDKFAVVSGSNKIYMWDHEGASCISIPGAADFQATELVWSSALLIADRAKFCCAYPTM